MSTMEVSSTTSKSHSSRLSVFRLKPPPFGSTSSSRWMVLASNPVASVMRLVNPIGGPSDDVCPPPFSQATCLANLQAANDIPVRDVLAVPPQPITAPLAIEGANSSFTGVDFVPDAFVAGPVRPGAVLYSLEGDFGFSPENATEPAPVIGHEVKLINFNQLPDTPLSLSD